MGLGVTGIAFLLSSCSPSKPEPPLATPSKGVTYEVRIFELPAKHPFGNEPRELMTSQQATDLLAELDRNPGFSGVITGQPGQTKTLSNQKNLSTQPSGLLLSYQVQTRNSLVADSQSHPPHPSHLKRPKLEQPFHSLDNQKEMESSNWIWRSIAKPFLASSITGNQSHPTPPIGSVVRFKSSSPKTEWKNPSLELTASTPQFV